MRSLTPRPWQTNAIDVFTGAKQAFLLEACPGAGKTLFAGFCADRMLSNNTVNFVIIVVPTTALKGDASAGFLGDFSKVGVEITTVLNPGKGIPSEWHGAVITYAQLPNIVDTFETWVRNGARLMFIFDEVHHASEKNVWGTATDRCGKIATKVLAMTGTPFRGDGQKIAFVKYSEDGICVPDYKYLYREAVAKKECRPVFFVTDSGTAEYVLKQIEESPIGPSANIIAEEKVRIDEAKSEQIGNVQRVIFNPKSEWLETVMMKADAKLDEYRAVDPGAGGLIVVRPGSDDETADRHLIKIAREIERMTGEEVTVITHEDSNANAKIERFRNSKDRWIVSVRKISEGVDIKRLRVLILVTHPGTELLFRQLVGRVVRQKDPTLMEDATVFMAKFPLLVGYAKRFEEEGQAGMRDREEKTQGGTEGREPRSYLFSAIGSKHENGGGISSMGEYFAHNEISFAENLKKNDPVLAHISVASIAYLNRKLGVSVPETEELKKPKQIIKKEKRRRIEDLVRVAAIKAAEFHHLDRPDYSSIRRDLNRRLGVKDINDLIDNRPEEALDAAISYMERVIANIGSNSHV